MRADRRTTKWLWRWRSNPLRRREDVLEAWLVLTVWAVIAVGGTLAGALTARATADVLAQQRAERTPVAAVLLSSTRQPGASSYYRASAKVRWTLPDGSTRTGNTLVDTGLGAGTHIVVYTDRQGELTTRPPSRSAADVEAAVLGATAGLGVTGATLGAGALARLRLDRRRADHWGREWATVGPTWGHKTG
ncbi:hypothetical protein ABZT17_33725 [Streptomyces sp. NPDC005648]|uniref:Rv1733c family protein n=1 Tax=Streptomyces sp. NPDC005648 TaxID=3157044 RepID=UPI0033AA353A